MNVITHALLPAILATPLLDRSSRAAFYREAGVVVLGGALPDVLSPHLSLAARFASWTHTALALAGFALALVLLRLLAPRWLSWKLTLLAWLAAALHLFGDAVSGGIPLFRPFSPLAIGPRPRWISYHAWWWLDGACILAALLIMFGLSRRFDRLEATRAT